MILFIFLLKVERVPEAAEAGQGIIIFKAGAVDEVDSERDQRRGQLEWGTNCRGTMTRHDCHRRGRESGVGGK